MTMITKNFSASEVACPCCHKANMQAEFMKLLQEVRDIVGVPLPPTSGYRCAAHNKLVGGAPASMHLQGRAIDIATSGDKRLRFNIIKAALKVGMTGVEVSPYHVHLDNRDTTPVFLIMDEHRKIL